MDVLKAQLEQIQQRLAGLTVSQKMLTASLVAIMVMTLLWWGRYASQAEMVPLLDQSFSEAEVTRITAWLGGRGIDSTVTGDRRIMVSAERKTEALAGLSYNELLPDNIADAFDMMVAQMNPFDSQEKTSEMFKRASELELGRLISTFPGVKTARVKLSMQRERRIGQSVAPSATIAITTESSQFDKKLINGAAALVAGAQGGLNKSNISVVVNGFHHPLPDENDTFAVGAEIYEQARIVEETYRRKVHQALSYIPGVIVTVQADVNNQTVVQEKTLYDPTAVVQKPVEEETRSTESTRSDPGIGEPGVVPNTPLSIEPAAVASGPSDNDTQDYTRTKFENRFSSTIEHVRTPAGKEKVLGVAIAIPRSFLVSVYKRNSPASQEPDDAALSPLAEAQLASVRRIVGTSTGLDEADVVAEVYPDLPDEMGVPTEPSGATVAGTVGSYGKEIAIGVLALVSLLMVSAMAKRGASAPVVISSSEPRMPQHLDAGEELAGVAGHGDALLDGMELDEDAVKAQQMLSQVQTMVKDNPDAAANLIKRWMNRS